MDNGNGMLFSPRCPYFPSHFVSESSDSRSDWEADEEIHKARERKKREQEGTYDPDEPDSPSDGSESSPRRIAPVSSSKARKRPAKRTSAALPASLHVQGADRSLSSSKPKGGAPSTEARRAIQDFADKVNADAEALARELGLRKATVMMSAGFSTKAIRGGHQNWNHHQSWYAYHFPKMNQGA